MRWLLLLLAFAAAQAQDGASGSNWPSYGGSSYFWRYSALDQINSTNVKKLAPAWIFSTGDYVQGLQSTPLVIDGVMYLVHVAQPGFCAGCSHGTDHLAIQIPE